MRNRNITITVYSLTHFLVDFACAYLIFHKLYTSYQFYFLLLIYNFCAFAMQMPFGLFADRLNKNSLIASAGCCLVAMAFGFCNIPLLAVLLIGIGNSLFHIGGGIEILNLSTEKAAPLGIFVSPGAFGIYFGTILGKLSSFPDFIVIIMLLLSAVVILSNGFTIKHSFSSENEPVSFHGISQLGVLFAIACLFIVVCMRSYVGMALSFPWKGQGQWGLILVCAVVLGKAAGGFLADWFGAKKAAILSLGLAALLFLFSDYPAAGVLAVLLFNMTMPITLWAIAQKMKGCKGFAFGILTFGLFLGFLPVYFQMNAPMALPVSVGFAAASVLSLVLLLSGLHKVET